MSQHIRATIMTQASTFGLGWLGDGTTIQCIPLLSMMVVWGDASPVVVFIYDCTDHMSEGGNKGAKYIAEMFQEKVNEFDSDGRNKHVFFFDDTSNVQNTVQILCQHIPRAYCFNGHKHLLSLFFIALSKLKPIQVRKFWVFIFINAPSWCQFHSLILKPCRLYNVSGSGANHGIHAQFMTHASSINNGKRIRLLRGVWTRFAAWVYALHCLFHQKKALLATFHSPYLATHAHNAKTALIVQDIESNQFWKQCIVCREPWFLYWGC